MVKRIAAIAFIYICTTLAWVALGSTVNFRTYEQDDQLRYAVGQLWGTVQHQRAPLVTSQRIVEEQGLEAEVARMVEPEDLDGSHVDVSLQLEHRRKGLLWYPTYRVEFSGAYRLVNGTDTARIMFFEFPLPAQGAVYDDFHLLIGEEELADFQIAGGSMHASLPLKPGQAEVITVSYASQGMEAWWYDFGTDVTHVKDFSLVMRTDFAQIDFPQTSISPTEKEPVDGGWILRWEYANLLSGVQIGMDMPQKLNPGPWVSKVVFFAPVSLFLFFFLLFLLTSIKQVRVHPMNYFFVGAAFFSYHLLLAYLVDHISIHLAFWISSLVSIFLVVSYMRLVVGPRFAFVEVGISQLVYLVLFSYTFFFEGYTGLTITVLCIVTLFIIMQFTGRVDWEELFQKGSQAQKKAVV